MSKKVNEYMNQLLADTYQLLCLTRQVHWYMRGERFFYLHTMLDDYIDEYNQDIDDIAEMLITFGGWPYSTLDELSSNSKLQVTKGDYKLTINEQLRKLVEGLRYYDKLIIEGLHIAEEEDNQPLDNLLSDIQASTQKHIWMLTAELGEDTNL